MPYNALTYTQNTLTYEHKMSMELPMNKVEIGRGIRAPVEYTYEKSFSRSKNNGRYSTLDGN